MGYVPRGPGRGIHAQHMRNMKLTAKPIALIMLPWLKRNVVKLLRKIKYEGNCFMVHCWKDYREWLEENGQHMTDEWLDTFDNGKTCMAMDGHDGIHEWIADSEISVSVL